MNPVGKRIRLLHGITQAVIVLGISNFFLLAFVSAILGGVADPAVSGDGHYFLSSHGNIQAVSFRVFTWSRIHFYSVWIGLGLTFFAVVFSYAFPEPYQGIAKYTGKMMVGSFFFFVVGPMLLSAILFLFQS